MVEAAGVGLDVVSIVDFGRPPHVDETGTTFAENAAIKARAFDTWLTERNAPAVRFVVADDSGICIDALDGAPGVSSARFAGPHATDADNNRALVDALAARGVDASPAHYACVLVLLARTADGAVHEHRFEGRFDVIVRPVPRGSGGFGYDPHAYLEDGRTVAELTADEKDAISHRGAALRRMVTFLREHGGVP